MTVEDLAQVSTLEELKEVAFRIPYDIPIEVCWPQSSKIRKLENHYVERFVKKYNVNNSVICFRTESSVYVIPYTDHFESILLEDGFGKRRFHVPFSNFDYPAKYQDQWDYLVYAVRLIREDELLHLL